MNNVQQQPDPFPRRNIPLFLAIIISTLIIAVIWALSDIGWIDGQWGKLAFVFFTWLAVVIGSWALLREKE